jgi:hypothetical protein
MLAGDDNLIKPDRMIYRFLDRTFPNQNFDFQKATAVVQDICKLINEKWNLKITPRELDHWIWKHEREKGKGNKSKSLLALFRNPKKYR